MTTVSATSGSSHCSTVRARSRPTPEPTCTRGTGGQAARWVRPASHSATDLASGDVVDQMVRTFESSPAPLAERLMAALALGRTCGRRHPGAAVCRIVGAASRRRLRGTGRPPCGDLDLRSRSPDRRAGAVLRAAPACLLPERPVEPGSDRPRAGGRAEDADGGSGLLHRRSLDDRWDDGRSADAWTSSWAVRTTTTASTTAGLFDLEVLADLRLRYGDRVDERRAVREPGDMSGEPGLRPAAALTAGG